MAADTYNDLVFKLGDVARERLSTRPNPPRSMDRVLRAEEALSEREGELQGIEAAMDEEEVAFQEFQAAVDGELEELTALTKEFKKTVQAAEARYQAAIEKGARKELEIRHAKLSLEKEEQKAENFKTLGEKAREKASRDICKNLRLEWMKRQREHSEMLEEAEKVMNPEEESRPNQAVRAKARMLDLEKQMEERTKAYNDALAELDGQAAEKEQEVAGARDYFDRAIFLLGEECYQQRVNDASLVPLYMRLDKAPR